MKTISYPVFILFSLVCINLCFSTPVFAAGYREKITIDHTKVFNENLKDFPVLISITDPDLRSASRGGHVVQNGGEDIFFTLPEQKTELSQELIAYNPANGGLKAWIRIPLLSNSKDTDIYLHYGGPNRNSVQRKTDVWDSYYKMVQHLNKTVDPDFEVPDTGNISFTQEITVEAWVSSAQSGGEALQPLVSKWSPLTSFNTFSAYDAGATDGLISKGFFGAVFDGRYVYFSPQRNGNKKNSDSGVVLRYDTQGDFNDSRSYSAYDAGNTAGMNTKGYYGAVFDGRYVYFVPRGKNYFDFNEYHSRVLRYDTHMDFKSSSSWDAYDVGLDQTQQSAAFDGRYIYFCPGFKHVSKDTIAGSSTIIRFDTLSGFKNPSSWMTFEADAISGLQTANFDGAAFDGRYIYFVPLTNGAVLQYDTTKDFSDKVSWRAFNAKPLTLDMCVGSVFDSRYLYFVPYSNSSIIRYDTYSDFNDLNSWHVYDAGNLGGLATDGFDGGFFDGRYVYFEPFSLKKREGIKDRFHSNFVRYDTQGRFDDTKSWVSFNAGRTDNLETIGYNGGAFDGRYYYLAPCFEKDYYTGLHGRILRYDTLGENGAFSLRYCDYGHNGGLNGAVPGPSFIVNTVKGPVSIFANKALVPGWHHIAGVYNGDTIKLFIDGILVNERSGSGLIQTNNVTVVIGRIQKGAARFKGVIDEVRISNLARNDNWIKTEYLNLINPADFIRVGEEEVVK